MSETLDSGLVMVTTCAETLRHVAIRDDDSQHMVAAVGHLGEMCRAIVAGDWPAAKTEQEAVQRTFLDARAIMQAAKRRDRHAALIADGWTPPEPAT